MKKYISFFICVLLCTGVQHGYSQISSVPDTIIKNFNGQVNALAYDSINKILYAGGSFSAYDAFGSYAAITDSANGIVDESFPKVNNTVFAYAPDGKGGFYIGGMFTQVGDSVRNCIAQIDSLGKVTSWNPNVNSVNSMVYAIALKGDTIFIGGQFTTVSSIPRSNFAVLDAVSGGLLSWNPGATGSVRALTISGNRLYAGGTFSIFGGMSRRLVAAINLTSFSVTSWNPGPGSGGSAYCIAVRDDAVYIGGSFNNMGFSPRTNIAAVDTAGSGNAHFWDPGASGGVVQALALSSTGDTIYAGGSFNNIGFSPRQCIAALNANPFTPGNAYSWNPGANATVKSIVVSGNKIYAAGYFTTLGGQTRRYLGAVYKNFNAATPWNPNASYFADVVGVYGKKIFAGGPFSSIGGTSRSNLAAIDVTTGNLTAFDPSPNNTVYTLAISGSTVFAGGVFTFIGGQTRNYIAAVDASTGNSTAWNVNANNVIYTLLISGNTLYAGGFFTNIGGQPRNRIAAIDATTGLATTWDPNSNNGVRALALSGTTMYVGGDFDTIGGAKRNRIAALYTTVPTNNANGVWDPNSDNMVQVLKVSGSIVYAAGSFTNIGGQTRNYIAALNAGGGGTATGWNPSADVNVQAIGISGTTVYVGGNFTNIGALPRNQIAALNNTGFATAWDPNMGGVVYALAVSGNTVYAGGSFTNVGGNPNYQNLVRFPACASLSVTVTKTNVNCNGGNDGTADAAVSGGSIPYTYSWSNGQTTQTATGLSAANYSVTVTSSGGCTATSTIAITQPAVLTVSTSVTNASCTSADGTATANPSGGTSPYTYLWSNAETTQTITGLFAGSYIVNISDANGCAQTQTATVSNPSGLSVTVSNINVSCNGGNNGSASVATVSGGTGPFTYSWSPSSATTTAITGLSAGTYIVSVTDVNGCVATAPAVVTEPTVLSSTLTPTSPQCFGNSNGSVALSVSGGTSSYTYLWNSNATTQNITNISAGTFSVLITDNNGCTNTNTVIVSQPAILTATISKTDVTCNGLCDGTATIFPSGGTAPYNYLWNSSPAQSTQTATGLCNGTFNVNLSDNNGCQATPNITIAQPNVLTVSVSVTDATCNNSDGSATATVSGGTIPYTFTWSNGNSNQTVNNLAAGNYSVAVTDSNGCSASATSTVSVVSLPQPICVVTVDSTSSKNFLIWEKTPNSPIDSFRIYREIASVYTQIASVSYNALSEFTDTSNGVNPNTTAYKYEVSALDSCGNESTLSTYHKTMHLQISPAAPPASFNLSWNDYEGISTITQYIIMRDSAFTGWKAVDSVSPGNGAWTDINSYPLNDTIAFYIRIDYPTGCVSSIKNPNTMATNLNTSRSNIYRAQDSSLVSVNDLTNGLFSNVYPNPSNGIFTLDLKNNNSGSAIIKVFNVLGEEMKRINCSGVRSKVTIDLTKQSKGVYYLQISSDEKIATKKIIIE